MQEDFTPVLPDDKVMLADGSIIDKVNRAFKLREHPKHKNLFFDSKGTMYCKNDKGVLHRYPPKVKKSKGTDE